MNTPFLLNASKSRRFHQQLRNCPLGESASRYSDNEEISKFIKAQQPGSSDGEDYQGEDGRFPDFF